MNWRAAVVAADPRPSVLEIVLAGVVTLIGILQSVAGQLGPQPALAALLAVGLGAAVLLARAFPLPAAALLCGVTVAGGANGIVPDNSIAAVVATIVVVYLLSAWAPLWVACIATVAIVATVVLIPIHDIGDILWESILMTLPFVAGQATRRHRLVVRRLEATTQELEQSRQELAVAAANNERMRVARDVHDIVAHSVSVMVIQASAAETAVETDVQAAKHSLEAIQATGRQALTELRGLLGVLRTVDDGAPAHTPQLGSDDLGALGARFAAAGLSVTWERSPAAKPLGEHIEGVLYRIVQESLTNALKHGGPGTAEVGVTCVRDAVTVQILNTPTAGRPPQLSAPTPSGHGIEGMRERVTSLGGTLTAAPTADHGYRVVARIPLAQRAQRPDAR